MKTSLLNIICLFSIFYFSSLGLPIESSNPNSLRSEIQTFLAGFPLIRVGISSGPGFGHQAAGAEVVNWLMANGYQGEIEVIYDTQSTAEKLVYLIPPFAGLSAGPNQSFPDLHLKFIYGADNFVLFNSYRNPTIVPLSIMGADDHGTTASALVSESLLKLQPMDWRISPTLEINTDDDEIQIELNELKTLGFTYNLPNPSNINHFLNEQLIHPLYRAKYPFLARLFSKANRRDILPVYGHGVRQGTEQLGTLIDSLLRGGIGHEDAYKNGIIIPVVNDISERNNWVKELKIRVLNSPTQQKFPVSFFNFDDPDLQRLMADMDDKRIIVVYLGAIPKKIFEYLYSRETLPGIVEGLNSINFMKALGKPYLPSDLSEGFYFSKEIMPSFKKINQTSIKAWYEISGESIIPENENSSLDNFYLRSYFEPKKMVSYFLQFKQLNENSEDQILLGLKRYKDEMERIHQTSIAAEKKEAGPNFSRYVSLNLAKLGKLNFWPIKIPPKGNSNKGILVNCNSLF